MSHSIELFERAQQVIPGGVNSPVRAFQAVGGNPLFLQRGEGAYIYDVDGQRYIDFVASWGPLIHGHCHPAIVKAVLEQAQQGMTFGAPTELEIQLAEKITQLVPSIESVRMVNSGTEATLSAIRLARGVTGRAKILKFAGCYHGHHDALLVKSGSGALTFGVPTSPGIPESVVSDTLVADYNNLDQVTQLFGDYGNEIAAIIVEPIAGNMGCVLPQDGFLAGLRKLCDEHGSLLIFDEVISGFRVAMGGAQELYGITPDLTTLGKIIGGGMPVGAFGGKRDIMAEISPTGPVYQAGTLSGNPLAMAAGLATIQELQKDNFYPEMASRTEYFVDGIQERADDANIPLHTHYVGSMFGMFFTAAKQVRSLDDVMACDSERYAQFFNAMLKAGVYFAPSAFESAFVSALHNQTVLDDALDAFENVFTNLK